MWEKIVQLDRSEMTIRRMRIACWITKATKYTLNIRVCNIYYFSIATMVTRMRLIVTLYVYFLSCFD